METPQENSNNKITPTLQDNTHGIAAYKKAAPIVDQRTEAEKIATDLLSVWVLARLDIIQMHPSLVPTNSDEELGLILRLMRQYGTVTPTEFAESIRLAAIDKQRDLAQGLAKFPTLYAADFEEQLQKMTMKKQREAEGNAALALPQNVGGNVFKGTPEEALAREWPQIVKQTKIMRAVNIPRDRFWVMGSPEQKDSAFGMLGQMVKEMKLAESWDQSQVNWEALAIFQADFKAAFPEKWHYLLEAGMSCPLKKSEVDELRQRVGWKIQAANDNGGDVPSIANFPDPQDATFCAVFDSYWKFKEGKS